MLKIKYIILLLFYIVACPIFSEEYSKEAKTRFSDIIETNYFSNRTAIETNFFFITRNNPIKYQISWEKYLSLFVEEKLLYPVVFEGSTSYSYKVYFEQDEDREVFITNTYYAIYTVETNRIVELRYKDIELVKKENKTIFKFIVREIKEIIKITYRDRCPKDGPKDGWTKWNLWTNEVNFVAPQTGLYEIKIDKNGFRWRMSRKK